MNLDSLSFTLSQISYLVANLSKRNFRESCQEISVVSIAPRSGPNGLYFSRYIPRQPAPPLSLSLLFSPFLPRAPSLPPRAFRRASSSLPRLPPAPLCLATLRDPLFGFSRTSYPAGIHNAICSFSHAFGDSIFPPVLSISHNPRSSTCPREAMHASRARARYKGERSLARCNVFCRAP